MAARGIARPIYGFTRIIEMTAFSPTVIVVISAALAIGFLSIFNRRLARKCRVLDIALNNMSQGLVLFDKAERMVLCNERYIDLYGLSPDVVKPGATFRDIIRNRNETGSLGIDVEKYSREILDSMANGNTISRIVGTPASKLAYRL